MLGPADGGPDPMCRPGRRVGGHRSSRCGSDTDDTLWPGPDYRFRVFSEPIIHVDMDSFFVECERLRSPSLVGVPVVVGGGGNRGVVASASYEARRSGVHSAQSMVQARRMCPQLIVVPTDHGYYQSVSANVFSIMRSFTPLVEGLSVDEAFLDVSGLTRHYDSPITIAEAVRNEVAAEVGIPSSAGVAATKFMAKLASTQAKPDGLLHVPADGQLEFLHGLSVRALWGVGEAAHAALERVGVQTIGELAELDVPTLQRLLGPSAGTHLATLARGEDPRPVVPTSEAKSISAEQTYGRDLSDQAIIRTEVLRHATRVAARLRQAGIAGRTVTLKMRFHDFDTPSRSLTLTSSTDVTRDLHRAALQLLDRMPRKGEGVRLLGIGVSHLEPRDAPRQLATDRPAKWDDLEDAVETVRSKYGEDAVGPAILRVDGEA